MENKVIACTGGTGSFGNAFVRRALLRNPRKILVVSRDEAKQHQMRLELNDERVQFEIGDVRDRDRMFQVMKGVDLVFHAAALKQVPSCEFFPMEAVKTNIIGTSNVLDAALANRTRKVVCLSTDKAVYPINAMGMSKALMEKMAITKSPDAGLTVCVTRYGNVMLSRGSVVPTWIEEAIHNRPITLTNGNMTRFLLTIGDAIELVLYALENGGNGDTFIKKAPACNMETLAKAVIATCNSKSQIQMIGTRHGEKQHETLIGQEEMMRTEDRGEYYRVLPDSRNLNYNKFFSQGQQNRKVEAYTSENTIQLDQETVEDLLQEIL
jgi:UDP-N-acetylglucosamine 4,6-dehydratase